jgi:hypothetical protein
MSWSPNDTDSSVSTKTVTLTKQIDVFGVHVYATDNVADEKMLHAANMMAEYLDNDEDGVPDNQLVVDAMVSENTMLLMGKDEDEMRSMDWNTIPSGAKQGLWDEETVPGGAQRGIFDAALEEIIHPITDVGYAKAYPEVFGTKPGTVVAKIMDKARGGHFKKVPEKYPDNAWYTYYDETCLYDCQITEYVYWALTSILGAQDFPGRLENIKPEWRFNTKEKLQKGDPEIYALLTDPQYKFPTVLPDGAYRAKTFTIEKYQSK